MKRTAIHRLALPLLGAILVLAAGCGDDDPTCPEPEPYPVAQFGMKMSAGETGLYPTMRFALESGAQFPAIGDTIATLDLRGGEAGLTRTFDASICPNFDAFAATVTNGVNDQFLMYVWSAGNLYRTMGTWESEDLGGGLDGDLSPDLAGVKVTKLLLTVIDSRIAIPGENPNGDGYWTDYFFTLHYLVYGTR